MFVQFKGNHDIIYVLLIINLLNIYLAILSDINYTCVIHVHMHWCTCWYYALHSWTPHVYVYVMQSTSLTYMYTIYMHIIVSYRIIMLFKKYREIKMRSNSLQGEYHQLTNCFIYSYHVDSTTQLGSQLHTVHTARFSD